MSRIKLICPFHVKSALSNIEKLRGQVDLIISVSDARSLSVTDLSQDLISSFRKSGIKSLTLVSKEDLSDIKHPAAFNFKQQKNRNAILKLIKDTLEINKYHSQDYRPHFQVLVAGFPNTGKSTLINLLKGKKVAISENLPGKTKKIAKFPIGDNIWIYDTPGILSFKHSKESFAHKLFLINCIPSSIKNYSEILEGAYSYLHRYYLRDLNLLLGKEAPTHYHLFLEVLAQKFKFKRAKDEWDTERAESKFLNILWTGKIKLNWDRDV